MNFKARTGGGEGKNPLVMDRPERSVEAKTCEPWTMMIQEISFENDFAVLGEGNEHKKEMNSLDFRRSDLHFSLLPLWMV